MLRNGITFSALQQRTRQISVTEAQLREFLGFLNKNGLLQLRTPLMQKLLRQVLSLRDLSLGVHYEKLSYRTKATSWTLLKVCARTTMPLILVVIFYSCILPGIGAGSSIILLLWASIGLILFSLYLHELCHILVVRQTTKQVIIVRSGSRLGILHKRLSPQKELTSALAGPLSALIACTLLGSLLWLMSFPLLAIISLLVGGLHLFSFLPTYSDGAILLANLRKRTP